MQEPTGASASIFLEEGQGFRGVTEGGAEPMTDRFSPWSWFRSSPGEESLASDRPGFKSCEQQAV